MGRVRRIGRIALVALLAGGLTACGGGGKPAGFQQVCNHISAAQDAMHDHNEDKANDEISTALGWTEAAVEDTSGADRTALERVLGVMQQAWGELDQIQARTTLRRAGQLCS